MTKLEKRLCVFAIVFVAVYVGAIAMTIHLRVIDKEKVTRIESLEPGPAEGQMMLAELLLPMLIFLTVTVCFIIVKKQRSKKLHALEASDRKDENRKK